MRYESIADIYSVNAKTRDCFLNVIDGVTDDEVNALPDGELWSIGYIIEHVAIVNGGMAGICGRLIEKHGRMEQEPQTASRYRINSMTTPP